MPTITEMELPKPNNWQEFEHMVRDAMAQRWQSSGLQMNGRPGQKQNGVDIFGGDDIGRRAGIQCKRYNEVPLIKLIESEIANAETFTPKLSTLYIATTADYDSQLQSSVRELSDERVAKGQFAVAMLFWGDIVSGLVLNPAILSVHYPNLVLPINRRIDPDRNLAALELGFYGGDLWQYVLLVHGEFGWMAQVDPDSLTAVLRMLERRAAQLLAAQDSAALVEALQAVREGCLKTNPDGSDWDLVEQHAKRVESRIFAARSHLEGDEARWLALACQLGRIYAHSDDLPGEEVRKEVEGKVLRLIPLRPDGIRAKFEHAATLTSGYEWANHIFGYLVNELRWA